MFLNIAFLSFILSATHALTGNQQLGPADISFERVEECEQPDLYTMKMPIQMHKINRTHAGFTTCVDLFGDLDALTFLNMTAAKWGDGGWKPNALNFNEPNICDILVKYVKKTWDGVLQALGRGGTKCLPKGRYCVDKLALELDGLFPSMLYGKFRIDVKFIWDNEPKGCVRAYLNSVPSKGGISG